VEVAKFSFLSNEIRCCIVAVVVVVPVAADGVVAVVVVVVVVADESKSFVSSSLAPGQPNEGSYLQPAKLPIVDGRRE